MIASEGAELDQNTTHEILKHFIKIFSSKLIPWKAYLSKCNLIQNCFCSLLRYLLVLCIVCVQCRSIPCGWLI